MVDLEIFKKKFIKKGGKSNAVNSHLLLTTGDVIETLYFKGFPNNLSKDYNNCGLCITIIFIIIIIIITTTTTTTILGFSFPFKFNCFPSTFQGWSILPCFHSKK